MFSCFLSLVFYSAGVQVFFGFKIVDNQANAGQSCAVSLPLFCSFMLSRSTYCFRIGYREREEFVSLCVSDFPNSQAHRARIVPPRGCIYDVLSTMKGIDFTVTKAYRESNAQVSTTH